MPAPAVVHNADLANVMREIADLLEIKGGNPFRIRAYRNLARTLDALGPSVQTMLAEQRDLDELPGVGPDLAGKLAEIVRTGSCALREQLLAELPAGLHTLLSIPGIGPRKVMALYRELGIHNLDQLAAAARDGSLCSVRGFGEHAAQRILENLQSR
ncbi:MAG TPA: helix-hairpin-helix domain-containing protein, partial [Telluria sp.]|nr:helix-hairpin-helix domain-containing protein [Telluria sp.]